jgi:hypothetical protein
MVASLTFAGVARYSGGSEFLIVAERLAGVKPSTSCKLVVGQFEIVLKGVVSQLAERLDSAAPVAQALTDKD